MVNLLVNIALGALKSPFLKRIANRLGNRFTAHGVVIILLQLENLGVLPSGSANAVDGLPDAQVFGWVVLAVGAYFVVKRHPKSKLDAAKEELEIAKINQELKAIKGS